jgi:4-amino-4-deoxy-L-arabinose transferase-like glycosyltransferase
MLVAAWIALVAARMFTPSDLYDKEQPRTISYTADLLLHHHWIMQYDTFGIPQTKPPLYNWLSLPAVAAFGFQEWTLKAPSIFASIALLWFVMKFGKWMQAHAGDGPTPDRGLAGMELALAAAAICLANPMMARLLYLARPDMLLTAFLTGAWYSATLMIQPQPPRKATVILFWLCAIGAALTKGPMVLAALFYLVAAAKFINGSLKCLQRSGWWWGLPLLLAVFGGWAFLAYQQEPEFFKQILLGREIGDRVGNGKAILSTLFDGPLYVILRFLPWSLIMLLLVARVPWRRWFKHPAGPAFLWILVMVLMFSFLTSKRPDRYAPVYPAIALAAAYYLLNCVTWVRVRGLHVIAFSLLMVIGLCVYYACWSDAVKTNYGQNAISFSRSVQGVVGRDTVLFEDGEQTPVETLLGRAQEWPPSASTLRNATWSIHFYQPGSNAVLVSEPISQVDGWDAGRLGLYRLAPGEGAAEYENSLKVPTSAAAEPELTAAPNDPSLNHATHWRQIWHFHTHPPGTDIARDNSP